MAVLPLLSVEEVVTRSVMVMLSLTKSIFTYTVWRGGSARPRRSTAIEPSLLAWTATVGCPPFGIAEGVITDGLQMSDAACGVPLSLPKNATTAMATANAVM